MDFDAGGLIIIARWYDLNDLVSWKRKARDIDGIARHEVHIEDSQDALMRYYEEIVVFSIIGSRRTARS